LIARWRSRAVGRGSLKMAKWDEAQTEQKKAKLTAMDKSPIRRGSA